MLRTLVKLAIVVLIVYAGVRIVPVFWTYVKFKDAVQETANFSSRRSVEEVRASVVKIAERYDVPITLQDVRVRKVKDATLVETSYSAQLEYFPGRFYPWTFDVKVEGAPPRYGDLTP